MDDDGEREVDPIMVDIEQFKVLLRFAANRDILLCACVRALSRPKLQATLRASVSYR